MLEFYRYKIGEFIALHLPRSIAYTIGIFFATLQFHISPKDRNAVFANLRVMFPQKSDAELRTMAHEVFANFGLYLVEFFRFAEIGVSYVQEHCSIRNKEYLDAALKQGKGAVILTAHIGNWELGGMALALLGYPLVVVALDHQNTKINDFFKQRRESKGMQVVSLGVAIRQCFKSLRKNKCVALLGDRDFSNSSLRLDFLHKQKNIPRGPAVLALHTGAPIVPIFIVRKNRRDFVIECYPPIFLSGTEQENEIIQKYSRIIEGQIYKYPTQWLMFREFWKE